MIWIFGTILASLIPPFTAILFYGVDRHRLPGLSEIFGRGDLLVIAIVITIGGVSETLPMIRRIPDDLFRGTAFAMIGAFLLLLAESLWYADITSTLLGKETPPYSWVSIGSALFFAASSFVSARLVHITAKAE
jgi:hypothetical protein